MGYKQDHAFWVLYRHPLQPFAFGGAAHALLAGHRQQNRGRITPRPFAPPRDPGILCLRFFPPRIYSVGLTSAASMVSAVESSASFGSKSAESHSVDKTLAAHLRILELRLELLNRQLMEKSETRKARNRVEPEIRAVTLALAHYRQAMKLEQSL